MVKFNLQSRECLGGLSFILVAVLGLWVSRDYPVGTATAMSTGYVPRLLCWGLLAFGLVIFVRGALVAGPSIGRIAWRPVIMVTISILAFALTIERLGMLIACVLVVVCGSFAGTDIRLKSIAISAIVLTAGCTLVFIWLLGLPIPIGPRF